MPEPDCPRQGPYVLKVKPGTYAWCACGRSQRQPYCDGSHEGTAFQPRMLEVEADGVLAWCGCKRSGHPPLCDGMHAVL